MMDKPAPQNPESEKALMGVILRSPALASSILARLPVEALYQERHRRIYRLIETYVKNRSDYDLPNIVDKFRELRLLNEIGGQAYLAELFACGYDGHADAYLAGVRQAWYDRRIDGQLALIRQQHTIENVETLRRLCLERETDTAFACMDFRKDMVQLLDEFEAERKTGGYKTNLPDLDRLLHGLRPSNLFTVAGRPGIGKTLLLGRICLSMAQAGVSTFYLTTEMTRAQFLGRLVPLVSGESAWKFRTPQNGKDPLDWTAVVNALDHKMRKLPIILSDLSNPSISDIYNIISREKPQVLFLDYLQRCNIGLNLDNRASTFAAFMTQLKNLAKDFKIVIVLGCQVKRETDYQKKSPPVLADLRESGGIEQESDQVLMLWQPSDKKGETYLREGVVRKNRFGPQGTFTYQILPTTLDCVPVAKDYGPREPNEFTEFE